jgi:hypothetical protein
MSWFVLLLKIRGKQARELAKNAQKRIVQVECAWVLAKVFDFLPFFIGGGSQCVQFLKLGIYA